jgi:hypothetical protein
MADNPVPHFASPSQLEAAGMLNRARRKMSTITFPGDLTVSSTAVTPIMLPGRVRLLGVEAYRAGAGAGGGAGGTTTANLYSKIGSADEVALLASALSFAQASGAGLRQVRGVNESDLRFNDDGIIIDGPTTILYAKITAIEAGATAPTNLTIVVHWEHA